MAAPLANSLFAPVPSYRNLVYAQRPSRPLRLDLYLPEDATGPVPVVAWFHGGGWRHGDKGAPATGFLRDHGFAVADVQYRLTDEAPAPANLHDCRAAIAWLRSHAAQFGLDPDRVGVSGGSAGGHLALLCGAPPGIEALADPGCPEPPVRAICSLCGPANLNRIFLDARHPRHGEFVELLELLLGGSLAERDAFARAISPLAHVRPDHPPCLLVHGAQDDIVEVDPVRAYVEAMRAAGADIVYREEPAGTHNRATWDWPAVAELILHFFRRTLT